MRLKILIADDHEAAREGLKQLLIETPVEICGACACGDDVVTALHRQNADAVLADVRMPGIGGLSLLAQIRENHRKLPVVMFSAYDNPTYVARAVALGANDYLLKSDSRETIVAAITGAIKGESPAANGLFSRIRRLMRSENLLDNLATESPLTIREAQVFRHIGLGLSNREIAQSLGISIETVKEHVQNMLRKVNASDRTDAAVRAVRLGLVDC